jgi:ribosomal protein L7Ae-like RNA K-turn-binding protein
LENKENQRLFGMLGFAMRAGKVVIGTENIIRIMPRKEAVKLILISAAASSATKKKLKTKSEYYNISAIEVDIDTERLGKTLGKTYAPAAVAITDEGFASEIKKASV